MADSSNTRHVGPALLRAESGKLISAIDVASEISNFEETSDGTLASIRGPLPYVPDYGSGYPDYGNPHGIFHALLANGKRDVLLIHEGDRIRVFDGWDRQWRTLIGPASTSPDIVADLIDTKSPQAPTQFESTPTGIIIVPQNSSRAYFYNGEIVLPLGYSTAPGAPTGSGPETSGETIPVQGVQSNDTGYFAFGYVAPTVAGEFPLQYFRNYPTTTYFPYVAHDFGRGRKGSVESDTTGVMAGIVLPSSYQAVVQLVDIFGNLSPLSGRSNTVEIEQEVIDPTDFWGVGNNPVTPDDRLKHIQWSNVEAGPQGTIGRIIGVTKDLKHSGQSGLYELSLNTIGGASGSFATLPDNSSTKIDDNVPDSWLVSPIQHVLPVPQHNLTCLAFGRNWIAGIRGDQGAIIPSMPGRYGTFLVNSEIYPDPRGGEVTAMFAVSSGLFVFTQNSCFLLTPNAQGDGWRKQTLSTTIGCIAPSSIKTMADGNTIWLGREGFYMMTPDGQITRISESEQPLIARISNTRAKQATALFDPHTEEYRCWACIDGAVENNICFLFSAKAGFRRRFDVQARAVCVTQDSRRYNLAIGYTKDEDQNTVAGAWSLDHEVQSFVPGERTYRIKTGWINAQQSKTPSSAKIVYLWLRETSITGSFTLTAFRDWRENKGYSVTDASGSHQYGEAPILYKSDDVPPIWGTAIYDQEAEPNKWVRRRPFWKRISVFLPMCEVYKIQIESTDPIEFIGMSFDDLPHAGPNRVT